MSESERVNIVFCLCSLAISSFYCCFVAFFAALDLLSLDVFSVGRSRFETLSLCISLTPFPRQRASPFCSNCGANVGTAKFCSQCGEKTANANAGPAPTPANVAARPAAAAAVSAPVVTQTVSTSAPAAGTTVTKTVVTTVVGGGAADAGVPNTGPQVNARAGNVRTWAPASAADREKASDKLADKAMGLLANLPTMGGKKIVVEPLAPSAGTVKIDRYTTTTTTTTTTINQAKAGGGVALSSVALDSMPPKMGWKMA